MDFFLYIFFISCLKISFGLTLFDSKIICFLNSVCESKATFKNNKRGVIFSEIEALIFDESYLIEDEKKRKEGVFRDRLGRMIQLIDQKIIDNKDDSACVSILNALKEVVLEKKIRDDS
jgi:hypothetical protein